MDKHETPSIHITRIDALILVTAATVLAKLYQDKASDASGQVSEQWYKRQADSMLDASQRVMQQFK